MKKTLYIIGILIVAVFAVIMFFSKVYIPVWVVIGIALASFGAGVLTHYLYKRKRK